ncbi:MAG: glycosyltransferase [Candidatus Omnitrophica bacterium]|nr:glycosyltransferase [Candidatus Omnitrophota bacterium]
MDSIRVLRIIARLNVGGPAIHTTLLCDEMASLGYESVLVVGSLDAGEADMSDLGAGRRFRLERIPELVRPISPWKDLKAFFRILALFLRERPHIVHTHTAKAGALGRAATVVYRLLNRLRPHPGPRPLLVHTFHGHVLEGYFGRVRGAFFLSIERILALFTDRLLVVSPEIGADLQRLGVGPAAKIRVVPLGLDLAPYLKCEPLSQALAQEPLRVGLVGRMVPIKQHEVFLRAAAHCLKCLTPMTIEFTLVGDGLLRQELETLAFELGIGQSVRWLGWRRDLPEIYATLDIVALSSDNEGTPVSLIEALASARPVVSTDVGGVRSLLGELGAVSPGAGHWAEGAHGFLVGKGDWKALGEALAYLLQDRGKARSMGLQGREYVRHAYSKERLARDMHTSYQELKRGV